MAVNLDLFSEDPAGFFAENPALIHGLELAETEALQLNAVRKRLASLLPKLVPLRRLAEDAKIETIDSLEDLAPLLFPHSFYRGYDEYLLNHGCYNDLTDWLQRLTSVDLSGYRDRDFATLDEWIDTLENEAGLVLTHSSGTTGRLSLLARTREEVEYNASIARMTAFDWSGRKEDIESPPEFSVVWTSFARGRSAVARGAHAFCHGYAGGEENFHALIPGEISADWHYFRMRVNRAGKLGQELPRASPYIADRIDEMNEMRAASDAHMDAMLELIGTKLKGRRVLVAGAPFVLHDVALDAARRGVESAFGPDSAVIAFGGLKGRAAQDRMAETILRFVGAKTITNLYVMTEANAAHIACEHGYFHIMPWTVAFLLDPVTGALMPRSGVRTGRMAVFDLLAKTYWGGIVTADQVTLDWTGCACGRKSPRVHPDIGRYPDGEGGALPPCPARVEVMRDVFAELGK